MPGSRVPRHGYIQDTANCAVHLGPGPNRSTIREHKIELDRKNGGELWMKSQIPVGTPGLDGPGKHYSMPPLDVWKERYTSFKLPPRIPIEKSSWSRPSLNEPVPRFVSRLYVVQPLCDPWWYRRPPGIKDPLKQRRSAPVLPNRNIPSRAPPRHAAAPAGRTAPAMPRRSASASALRRPQSASPATPKSSVDKEALEEELRALRKGMQERDSVIAQLNAQLNQQQAASAEANHPKPDPPVQSPASAGAVKSVQIEEPRRSGEAQEEPSEAQ